MVTFYLTRFHNIIYSLTLLFFFFVTQCKFLEYKICTVFKKSTFWITPSWCGLPSCSRKSHNFNGIDLSMPINTGIILIFPSHIPNNLQFSNQSTLFAIFVSVGLATSIINTYIPVPLKTTAIVKKF